MDRIIRSTTDHFLKKLDSERPFFTVEEVSQAGFPDFLVERIRLELIRNLRDSVNPPESDWADMQAPAVQDSWDHFLKAIREEVRLPASYARPVLESAIGDILELMVAPRAFLPDYLFGRDEELDFEGVRERCEWIVVYNYFSRVISRFMEKKGRDKLTREQARRIIQRLDERVTAHYTSLNWAQLFEPWFELIGEQLESDLFARFFRDKGLPGVARHFDLESGAIHRTRLIEILSKPPKDDSEERTFAEGAASSEQKQYSGSKMQKGSEMQKIVDDMEDSVSATTGEHKKTHEIKKTEARTSTTVDEDNILSRFRSHQKESDDHRLHDQLKSHSGNDDRDDDERPLISRLSGQDRHDSSTGGKEIPIWQQFSGFSEHEEEQEHSRIENDIRGASEDPVTEIRKYVSDMEDEFIETLFGGDENAFLEALAQISQQPDWKRAGSFIHREVFDRNMVDIYSDTAIYFTDRMQTWFLEKDA